MKKIDYNAPIQLILFLFLLTSSLKYGLAANSPVATIELTKLAPAKNTLLIGSSFWDVSKPLPIPPAGCTGTDPSGNPATAGLYAEYYAGYSSDDPSFFVNNTPALVRVPEAPLNYTNNFFSDKFPIAGPNPQGFSARYRGSIYIATAGTYTFYLTCDDGGFLWLDNAALDLPAQNSKASINNGGSHSAITRQVSVYLTAGLHNVLIHYGQGVGGSNLIWEYEGPGITRTVVTGNVLCSARQPLLMGLPVSVSYSPASGVKFVNQTFSSPVPVINNGGSPITQYLLTSNTPQPLPAGITVGANGVISVDASVPIGYYSINLTLFNANGVTNFVGVYELLVAAVPPVGCVGTDPGGNPAVGGLYAEYYAGLFNDNPNFFVNNTPALVRVPDALLSYTNNFLSDKFPIAGPNPQGFSARYRGSIYIATAGTYTFYLTCDDGGFLWLDNAALDLPAQNSKASINNGGSHSAITRQVSVYLTAGLHNVLIHYGQGLGDGKLALEYEGPGIVRQVIPANVLCSSLPRPVANNDSYETNANVPLQAASVLLNDTSPTGSALTAVVVSNPSNGSLTLNPNGSFTYTPSPNFSGSDSFTYQANDGSLNSNVATVIITVNDAPVAVNDAYSTNENTPLNIALPGVLGNDTDTEGSALTAVLVSSTSNGSLNLNPNGSFTYTPSPNFSGTTSFTYQAFDGSLNSNVATVTIIVVLVNEAPVAVNDTYSTNENTALSIAVPGVLANDSDADNDVLTAVLISSTSNGTLSLNPNGSFIYTPSPNFNGSDSFTYQANDGNSNFNVATVTITVVPVNDAPVAVNDAYSTNENTLLTIAQPGVLGNDSDIDNDALSAVLVSTTTKGTLTLNANGSFSYTSSPNFNGSDSFTYRANDGSLTSNLATVTITVNAVDDAPVAVNDAYSTDEDTPLTITLPGILANDTDADGSALSAVLVSTTTKGTLTLNANGSFSYTPSINFNGNDSFTYRAFDGQAYSQTATVTITVTPVNDQPIALDDQVLADETKPVIIDVLQNDSDVDGDVLTTTILSPPTKGTLKKTGNGTYEYTPQLGFNGSDNFSYEVCDNGVSTLCDQATVVLNITQLIDEVVLYEGISPNGDGMNDTWIIENINEHPRNAVRIFNRWGTLVFEQQDYDNDSKVWKGNTNRGTTVGGDQLPNGTYFYTIEFNDSKTLKKGYVVLNR